MTSPTRIKIRTLLAAAIIVVGAFCAVAEGGCAAALAAARTFSERGGYNLESSSKGGVPVKEQRLVVTANLWADQSFHFIAIGPR